MTGSDGFLSRILAAGVYAGFRVVCSVEGFDSRGEGRVREGGYRSMI